MTTTRAPECLSCKHFDRTPGATKLTCAAFPEGIPDVIAFEGRSHHRPYPGDHGIRFEPMREGAAVPAPPAPPPRVPRPSR